MSGPAGQPPASTRPEFLPGSIHRPPWESARQRPQPRGGSPAARAADTSVFVSSSSEAKPGLGAPAAGASVMGREVSPPPLGPASVLLKAGSLPVALTDASSLRRGVLNVPASLQTRSCTPRSGRTQAAGAQGPAPSHPGKVASAPSRPGKMHVPQPNAPGAPELRHSWTPLSGQGEPQAPHRPYCFNRKRASEVAGDGSAFPKRPR